MFLEQLSLGKRRLSRSTLTNQRIMRDSNVWLTACCKSPPLKLLWADDMDFFHNCGKGESFREAITRFRASGMTMKLARSATGGILMPTKAMMRHVEVQKFASFDDEVWTSVALSMRACIIGMDNLMLTMEI